MSTVNGPLQRVQGMIFVEVFNRGHDSHILLDSVGKGDTSRKRLDPGQHKFLYVEFGLDGEEGWALLASDQSYGKTLQRLRGLEKAGSIEAAWPDGRAFFNA